MVNFHVQIRRVVNLPESFQTAICHLSANSFYDLFINGKHTGRGPSPSFPAAQYFDTHNLSSQLRPGKNLIALRCYNFGKDMKSVLEQCPGEGGLIVQLECDGNPVAVTDTTWKVLQDPSRQQITEPITGHRGGFKEICDGRNEILGWFNDISFDDTSWSDAVVTGPAEGGAFKQLIPREIPFLRTTTVFPVDAYFHSGGCAYGGETYEVIHPSALLVDDDSATIVQTLKPEFPPSILIDFGRAVFGRFEIEFSDGGEGGTTVEISYGESLNLTVVDRYTLRRGAQSYSPVERRGGRYLALTFRNLTHPVRICRVACHEQSYPVERLGNFSCSDPLLNRIWEVGLETSRNCMQDHFEDCPWREQTLYSGEIVVSGIMASYAWGDQFLARKCLRQFARTQRDNGEILPCGPAPKQLFILPEYPACWIIALWHHQLYWNDLDLMRELWPAVLKCLQWYKDRSDVRGFFVRRPDEPNSRFIDNLSNLEADDELAAEQIFYCHALRCAARLAQSLGQDDTHRQLMQSGECLARNIEQAFWSEERQCLLDTLKPVARNITQITNGLALLFDIVDRRKQSQLIDVLLSPHRAPAVRAGNMAYHMVEALAHVGQHDAVLARIREYWGEMLARGATQFWEVFDPESPAGSWPQRLWSLTHAFCAGPVYSLPAHFGGIRPLEPGFSHAEIAPKLVDLHWIKASVTTPRGEIDVTATRARGLGGFHEIEFSSGANMRVDAVVELPHRDAWNVTVNGVDVPLRLDRPAIAEQSLLSQIHPQMMLAELEKQSVRLRFRESDRPLHVRVRAATGNGPAASRIVVAEVAGDWRAAPPPV
jgi:hypothetical protein